MTMNTPSKIWLFGFFLLIIQENLGIILLGQGAPCCCHVKKRDKISLWVDGTLKNYVFFGCLVNSNQMTIFKNVAKVSKNI